MVPMQESAKKRDRGAGKPMTIPVGIRVHGAKPEREIRSLDLNVIEDGEPQQNLSIRAITNSPISVAVLLSLIHI